MYLNLLGPVVTLCEMLKKFYLDLTSEPVKSINTTRCTSHTNLVKIVIVNNCHFYTRAPKT